MRVLPKILAFDWDKGNLDKSRRKHGVTPEESESVFVDENKLIVLDPEHSETEKRFIILGRSSEKRMLFVVFTRRRAKIRIISARRMHGEEVEKYDKVEKNP